MLVRDVMTIGVKMVRPDATIFQIAKLMRDEDIGAVPVVEDGYVVGMITDRDICMAAYTKGRPLSEIRVREVMARNVVTCRSSDSIGRVEVIMQERRVRRLPVTDVGDQ